MLGYKTPRLNRVRKVRFDPKKKEVRVALLDEDDFCHEFHMSSDVLKAIVAPVLQREDGKPANRQQA